jgi:hypothetical protein
MLRLLATLTVAAVSVSACGGSAKNPNTGVAGSGGEGGEGGEGGSGGSGGAGPGSEADAGAYDAPPVPSSIPLEMAPALVAGVVCAKTYACCQPMEGLRSLTMTQAACEGFLTGTLAGLMGQANLAIGQGRAAYDPAALAACLMKYTDQSCPDARVSGGLSAYRMCEFVRPLVAVGSACQNHVECTAGYCAVTNVGAGTDGTCVARKANGETCQIDDECVGRRCASQRCADPRVEGLCGLPGAP